MFPPRPLVGDEKIEQECKSYNSPSIQQVRRVQQPYRNATILILCSHNTKSNWFNRHPCWAIEKTLCPLEVWDESGSLAHSRPQQNPGPMGGAMENPTARGPLGKPRAHERAPCGGIQGPVGRAPYIEMLEGLLGTWGGPINFIERFTCEFQYTNTE